MPGVGLPPWSTGWGDPGLCVPAMCFRPVHGGGGAGGGRQGHPTVLVDARGP